MPLPRLIPCLDVAGGRVVKGVRFAELRDVGDPAELGGAYSDAGADELVFLDITATLEGRGGSLEVARRVATEIAIPFTVGGGVRSVGDASALLEAGADKVSVNSAALARPELVDRGTPRRLVEWARECEERGAGELLVTSIDRDGTRSGYDLAALGAVADAVSIPVIASGGAGGAEHVAEALQVAQAALLASILHERPARLRELRAELSLLGVPLRDAA